MMISECTICGISAINQCGKCKSAGYCSAACQKLDWPLHKLLCSELVTFLEKNPRPADEVDEAVPDTEWERTYGGPKDNNRGKNDIEKAGPTVTKYKLAIFLPEKSEKMEFVWVRARLQREVDNGVMIGVYSTIAESLEKYMDSPECESAVKHGRYIDIYVGGNSLNQDEENKTFKALNQGYESCDRGSAYVSYPFAGNIVISHFRREEYVNSYKEECEYAIYEDVTLQDLRSALQYMCQGNSIFESDTPNKIVLRDDKAWSKAVMLSCSGDMEFLGLKKYRQVLVKSSPDKSFGDDRYGPWSFQRFLRKPLHTIFRSPDISSISRAMGMTLLFQKMAISPLWRRRIQRDMNWDPLENGDMVTLMLCADPRSLDFGTCELKYYTGQGETTVLFARRDKKDLTTHQLEALKSYMDDAACKAFFDAGYEGIRERERVLTDLFQTSKFEGFFEQLKQQKLEEGDNSWADAQPPPRTVGGQQPSNIPEESTKTNAGGEESGDNEGESPVRLAGEDGHSSDEYDDDDEEDEDRSHYSDEDPISATSNQYSAGAL